MNGDEQRFWEAVVVAYVVSSVRAAPQEHRPNFVDTSGPALAASAAAVADAVIEQRRTRVPT